MRRSCGAETSATDAEAIEGSRPFRVLAVDDDQVVLAFLERVRSQAGSVVAVAANGLSAPAL